MTKIYTILLLIVCSIAKTTLENILGCGGFVKSHVPIDFSKVEVKLLTKQGILKDKINCAPNNGYYFVPLYDKGEYTLELEPPPGWSFTPTKVDLVVDGVSDLCSLGKDIDFNFKGFGITGKVESLGTDTGPEGVEVELQSEQEIRKTFTSSGGNFFFTPVYPGEYIVKISNSKWKVWKDNVKVVVAEGNTELPKKSLIIQGYDVIGTVKDEGEPIKDTVIILYSKEKSDHAKNVYGCDESLLPVAKSDYRQICHVKTNEQGIFTFPAVPRGKYMVAPHYVEQNIYYQPNSIDFQVDHDSVILKENFEIVGFNINGCVLKSPNGSPLPKAKIYLNGKEVAETDSKGIYKLQKLKAGVYNIQAIADGFLFKEMSVKINPNIKIPDLVPLSYQVCGNVVSDKPQTITFTQVGTSVQITTLSSQNSGQFCEYLNPGKYNVQVVVDNADLQKGLQFYPKIHTIEVTAEQTGSIVFSQLKATVSGKVLCIQKKDCTGLKVILKASEEFSERNDAIISISDDGSFVISDIYPGKYEVTLSSNRLCWKESKHIVNVNNINVQVAAFVQTGYSVVFISSHDTQVVYKAQNAEHRFKVNKGRLSYCLEKSGSYSFKLDSCHSYESDTVNYTTDSLDNEIFLNALKHTSSLVIESDMKHGDVRVMVNIDGVKTLTEPLLFGKNGYEMELLLSPSETAVLVPQSDILYFNPPILSVTGSTDCEDLGVKFKAVLGVVFRGKIIPPLSGVLVTVETENFDTLMAETDENGVYVFPPLDKSKFYKIAAKKDSYVLVGPNNDGDFVAHKLAEIVIEVLDKANEKPLQGALLSLSGGDSYRSNLQTNEVGQITFRSLSPGEYFLRPMMKEYSFVPNSKIITVDEGQTVTVQLIGKRVAYSAYGYVSSLNREPEQNIIVVALGTGNCSHFSEESTSESNGQFRIRGLQPHCSYDITVKNGLNSKHPIERSGPKAIHLNDISQDIHDLQLVIFRPVTYMDLLVKVYAVNPEHYKSLRLKVICETTSNTFYTGRVDTSSIVLNAENNQGVLMQIPPVPLDGKTYSVYLESNLNNKLEPAPEFFTANSSFKYVELDFVVKSNLTEQDIKQTSVWTLVLIFSIMLAVYNIDNISQFVKTNLYVYVTDFISSSSRKPVASDYTVDNDDIDQIVQSINAVKRKPKPKKI